jgi:hypothetical protein
MNSPHESMIPRLLESIERTLVANFLLINGTNVTNAKFEQSEGYIDLTELSKLLEEKFPEIKAHRRLRAFVVNTLNNELKKYGSIT